MLSANEPPWFSLRPTPIPEYEGIWVYEMFLDVLAYYWMRGEVVLWLSCSQQPPPASLLGRAACGTLGRSTGPWGPEHPAPSPPQPQMCNFGGGSSVTRRKLRGNRSKEPMAQLRNPTFAAMCYKSEPPGTPSPHCCSCCTSSFPPQTPSSQASPGLRANSSSRSYLPVRASHLRLMT